MSLRNSPAGYGTVARVFHWATVAAVTVAWSIGMFREYLPQGATRSALMFTHITLGLAIVALLAARVLWRLADPAPPHDPTPLGRAGEVLTSAMHGLFYLLMIVIPLTGIAILFARGRSLPVFGLFEIASPWTADRAFARSIVPWHEWLSHALLGLAAAHAAAAIVHHRVFHDRTLIRMIGRT